MVRSAYIHIPFCQSICSYCDFCKFLYSYQNIDLYLKRLQEEVKGANIKDELTTLYLGGGTPSCLSLKETKTLFSITDSLPLSKDVEFTIEVNPSDITEEKLFLWHQHRVNRLSIGIESFQEEILKTLGRNHSYDEIKEKITLAKKIGFTNISVDLMYAIPNETMEQLKDDLEKLLSLKVSHISCYSLMIEPRTKLYLEKVEPIKEEVDVKMYQLIHQTLEKNGFHQYEISNYAKKGRESKHNLVYWNNQEYYGFGLGAASYLGNIRSTNTKKLKTYYHHFEKEEETLNDIDKMRYEMILGLRKIEGVNKREFFLKYHQNIQDVFNIDDLIEKKVFIDDGTYLSISYHYLYISNEILTRFVE